MSRSVALAHIIRRDDGISTGVWGTYTLASAFQPIFLFDRGKLSIAAFEGLIRPFRDGVPVPPSVFFPSIAPLDRFHVETLARTLHLLNAGVSFGPDAGIFINFDPSLFSDRAITDAALRDMRLVLHEAGIEPHRIVCEVTEQRAASPGALHGFVEALREHGLKIAVDDYGADDSDIRRIEALKPDIVKFDAHWITHLMDSGPGFALLSAMVETFAARGILTVFEGIEESWQLELAERSGASMVQGYALARPEFAPTSFSAFVREQAPASPQAPVPPRGEGPLPRPASRSAPHQPKPFGRRSTGS